MIDFEKLIEMQRSLDEVHFTNVGYADYPLKHVRLAYIVELGEFLNEWQPYLYWKSCEVIVKEAFEEKFADLLHFALSLEYNSSEPCCHKRLYFESINLIGENPNIKLSSVYNIIDDCLKVDSLVLYNTIALGYKLGLTLDEMEKAYIKKHEINWEKVNSGY